MYEPTSVCRTLLPRRRRRADGAYFNELNFSTRGPKLAELFGEICAVEN